MLGGPMGTPYLEFLDCPQTQLGIMYGGISFIILMWPNKSIELQFAAGLAFGREYKMFPLAGFGSVPM